MYDPTTIVREEVAGRGGDDTPDGTGGNADENDSDDDDDDDDVSNGNSGWIDVGSDEEDIAAAGVIVSVSIMVTVSIPASLVVTLSLEFTASESAVGSDCVAGRTGAALGANLRFISELPVLRPNPKLFRFMVSS